jgi:hypothetical protein
MISKLTLILGILWQFTAFATPWNCNSQLEVLPKVMQHFQAFTDTLTETDLTSGSCVKNATTFAQTLNTNTPQASPRIVFLVRQPGKQYMPQPMIPNLAFTNDKKSKFWIWHAFVLIDNCVFDANYTGTEITLNDYYQNLWQNHATQTQDYWVFTLYAKDIHKFAGSSYPGAPPKMLNYTPIDFETLISHPGHISSLKKKNSFNHP